MAANQYLVPGGAYINEGTSQIEYLVPGGVYVNETSTAPAAGNNAGPLHGSRILNKALVGGGLVA